jgi:chorismate mutase
MSKQNLDDYRKEIAKIDDALIELLIKRFELTDEVGLFKKKNNIPIENKEVETKLLTRLVVASHGKIDSALIFKIYSAILTESKERQKRM